MPLNVKIPKNVFAKARENLANSSDGKYGDDIELSPGRHVAILERIDVLEVKDECKIVLRCKIAGESEQAGGRASVWYTLNEEYGHYALKALQKLGCDVDSIDEKTLEKYCNEISMRKPIIRLTAKQSKEYVNVYFDKVLEDLSAADIGGESSTDVTHGSKTPGMGKNAPAAVQEKPKKKSDDLDEMDRAALKEVVEQEEVEISIKKTTSEDEIREAIRAHRANATGDDVPPEGSSSSEQTVEVEVGMAVKITVKGKKQEGKIVGIDEDAGIVKVKTKDGVVHKIDDVSTLDLA